VVLKNCSGLPIILSKYPRYSGADNILERFSITSSGPIVGNWNVNIESPEIFGQSASAQTELWLKVKYRAEHNRSFTVSSD